MDLYAVKLHPGKYLRQLDAVRPHFDAETLSYIESFRDPAGAQQHLFSFLLSRVCIARSSGLTPPQYRVLRSERGKPYIENMPIHFNVSHSRAWLVCAVGKFENGVDVEKLRDITIKIAQRFFSTEEKNNLCRLSGRHFIKEFFSVWTAKESYIKATGDGLSLPLDSFTVPLAQSGGSLIDAKGHVWFFKRYAGIRGYAVSLCVRENNFPEKIKFCCEKEILKEYLSFFE